MTASQRRCSHSNEHFLRARRSHRGTLDEVEAKTLCLFEELVLVLLVWDVHAADCTAIDPGLQRASVLSTDRDDRRPSGQAVAIWPMTDRRIDGTAFARMLDGEK